MKKDLWLIWKDGKTRRRYKIGILTYENDNYIFKYVEPELEDAKKVGFKFFPGFDEIDKEYKSDHLFLNIATRLPNEKRPDYLEILNTYDLDNNSTKLDILIATKGRLITDNYEFVLAFDNTKIEFDLAGTRYCDDINSCKNNLDVGSVLYFELEPDNKFDENAIKVIYLKAGKKYHIGYVPRYYARELSELLKNNVKYSALIQNINFESEFFDEDITVDVRLIFDNKNC